MKWIGQHIYDQISRFRNKVYFEGDVEFNTDAVTFQSANADDPIVTIKNTSNAANDMASLNFVKDRDGGTAAINDNLAEIYFSGEDASGNAQEYGRILCEIDVATHGQESGRLKFGVANHDGGNGYGLTIQGGSADDEVDVTVGLGTSSVTTVAGTLTMGSTAAMTNAGLLSVANQSNITGVGTITSGDWNGTAIAVDQQKHLMHYEFTGFNNGSTATNVYEYSEPMQDTKAPMEHTKNHNATITTAMGVGNFFKSGGQAMPRACTVKKVVGWFHSNGTSAEHKLAIVRLRPVENDSDNVSPVLVQETTWTSLGNDKLKSISATGLSVSLNAGDILMTMIKDNTGSRIVYFNVTVEVEF